MYIKTMFVCEEKQDLVPDLRKKKVINVVL